MTDTPMTPERDPSRREELLFMLLHGGARDAAIAQRVVDLALAEARAEQKAEVDRLRGELSDATAELAETVRAMNALRRHRDAAEARVRELEARPTVGYAVWCVEQSLGDEAAQRLLGLNPDLKGTP